MFQITPEIARMIDDARNVRTARNHQKRANSARRKPSPGVARQIDLIVTELATGSGDHRREMVAGVRSMATPAVLDLVVKAVIDRLGRSRNSAVRLALGESLVLLGPPAARPATSALMGSKSGPHQAALASVLEQLAPALSAADLFFVALPVSALIGRGADLDAEEAIARAAAALFRTLDSCYQRRG